jgi:hypothetical protein
MGRLHRIRDANQARRNVILGCIDRFWIAAHRVMDATDGARDLAQLESS